MRLHEEIAYPAAPAAVLAVLTDPAFLDAACRASGALEHSADVRSAGDAVEVSVRRVLPTTGLPDGAARLVGSRMVLQQRTTWRPGADGGHRGALSLTIEGAPVTLTGEVVLRPSGEGGSVQVVDADLVAKVPLFGGAVERAAAPGLAAGLRGEGALAVQWLAGNRS